MKKINSYILGCNYSSFPDEKTGEMVEFTKISYTLNQENSDKQIGPKIMTSTKRGDFRKIVEDNVMKNVVVEIDEIPTDTGCKYSIKSINNQELKTK